MPPKKSGARRRPRLTAPGARFGNNGLIPAVTQDAGSGRVLMLAWMNAEALRRTLRTGAAHYWSRSRGKLWRKGSTSGHTQKVRAISVDCDGDTILLQVEQKGPACHNGTATCFGDSPTLQARPSSMIAILDAIIDDRRRHPPAGSYTFKLLRGPIDDLIRKIGEESTELVLAAKNPSRRRVIEESCDVLYHLLVLCARRGIRLADLETELERRHLTGKVRKAR